MQELAIVILNWNGRKLLERFLPDVVKHAQGARVIVADNGSDDDSLTFLKEKFPMIERIRIEKNLGFAAGYNTALAKVDAKFYLLLNNDVEVSEGWLTPLLHAMEDPEVAACQPKICSYNNHDSFEHAGASGGFIDRNYFTFCRGRIFDTVELDKGQYDYPTEIFWASGAALLIRSEVFHKHRGFDPDFFAHMEEIDLCWRIKRTGFKILAIPESQVYHVGGGTLTYLSPQKAYLNFRNNLLMLVKNHEGWLLPKLFTRMCYDGLAGLRFLLGGEFKLFLAVLKAHFYLYVHLSANLKKRMELKKVKGNFNRTGLFTGNILWHYYFKKVKKFSDLNQRLFK